MSCGDAGGSFQAAVHLVNGSRLSSGLPVRLGWRRVAVAVQGRDVPAGRHGRYWNDEVVVGNTIAPWRGPLTIYAAKRGASGSPDYYRTDIRMAQVARAVESLTYDLDGNLTSDGISDYTWDAENRLIKVETNAVARAAGFPDRIVELRYDYMGRRVQRTLSEVGAGGTVQLSRKRFLYEGWRMVAEYVLEGGGSVPAIYRTYTWGLDVVGSLRESGGVGALLQIADHRSRKTFLTAYDSKGNVVALFNAETGSLAAAYEYNAFGEYLRVKGPDPVMADNPFRFSTKYSDEETGLVDYGRRHYDPRNGRFLGRDPIEERGGLNLFGFCGNNGIDRWDLLGMRYVWVSDDDGGNEEFDRFQSAGRWEWLPDEYEGTWEDWEREKPVVLSQFDVTERSFKPLEDITITNRAFDGFGDPSLGGFGGQPAGLSDAAHEQFRRECDGLDAVVRQFEGSAQATMNRIDSRLAHAQRLRDAFAGGPGQFFEDSQQFLGAVGGDLSAMILGLVFGPFAGIGNTLYDATKAVDLDDGASAFGYVIVASWQIAYELRNSIDQGAIDKAVGKWGLAAFSVTKAAIEATEAYGPTISSEFHQSAILSAIDAEVRSLRQEHLTQASLALEFRNQWKSKGCDKL
jgi:RHS repeat-associated protein